MVNRRSLKKLQWAWERRPKRVEQRALFAACLLLLATFQLCNVICHKQRLSFVTVKWFVKDESSPASNLSPFVSSRFIISLSSYKRQQKLILLKSFLVHWRSMTTKNCWSNFRQFSFKFGLKQSYCDNKIASGRVRRFPWIASDSRWLLGV